MLNGWLAVVKLGGWRVSNFLDSGYFYIGGYSRSTGGYRDPSGWRVANQCQWHVMVNVIVNDGWLLQTVASKFSGGQREANFKKNMAQGG